ncbi:type VII toxin-antitoxin system HepT family RNase toxin [Peribacillus asahii]|nr:DUF86 domain-containing protein [Peribacillus asahii]USK87174.1 DUF86 domain-containing protein [Peribacillus asahii]
MRNDVILHKISVIERCKKRILDVYGQNPNNLKDLTKQDSIILHIQRACQACIDLAMHIVAQKRLGLPRNSRDAFDMLQSHSVIDEDISYRMKMIVEFKNIAVKDYGNLNLDTLQQIIEQHIDDFTDFTKQILKY